MLSSRPAFKRGGGAVKSTPEEDARRASSSVVLRDTEKVWGEQFRQMGKTYREPKLVIFRDVVQSACGLAQAAVGPFYCPADETVYIDLAFFDELERRRNAPGDFAQAYVIAHEVGHHVQKLLGITDQFDSLRSRIAQAQNNELLGAAGTAGRFLCRPVGTPRREELPHPRGR